jgi:hypothetical protein
VRRMPMGFSATLITIPSVYVVSYATPLGGSLVRNVLILGRCSRRCVYNIDDGDPIGYWCTHSAELKLYV